MHKKVVKFAQLMQEELENNSHKGNWESFTDEKVILTEFEWHFKKVLTILRESKDLPCADILLKEHLADCANILMFLGNSYELYDGR